MKSGPTSWTATTFGWRSFAAGGRLALEALVVALLQDLEATERPSAGSRAS
jgi:hypothetical protein